MHEQLPLPESIESAVIELLEQPADEFWVGVAQLCRDQRQYARSIVSEAVRLLALTGREVRESAYAASLLEPNLTDLQPGDRVGAFVVLEEIGRGGMGVVFLAEQKEPVRRRVALKVIKLGMDTRAVLARFEAERQALALMEHGHIAKVFEAGATPQGRPYFVMEYVPGIKLTEYCDRNKLDLDQRLALFLQACAGVQHAHSRGVIHRDLTPNNLLVTLLEGMPMVKIIDFGLARATNQRLTEKTLFTERGVILGTPEYMSPEQAGLNELDIDIRSDVYTLGVVLYELLTSQLPFDSMQLRAAGYEEMCKTIRESDPPRPSTKVQVGRATDAVATGRRTDRGTFLRRLRGDLDWIVLKCLEKDRIRRYATVSELAADVQRHLHSEPVLARAPSFAYRLQKLARRNRRQLVALSLIAGALIVGLISTAVFATQALARQREFDHLAAVIHLQTARAAERDLFPPWPHKAAEMRRWLHEDVARLLAKRAEIAEAMRVLRTRATPPARVTSSAYTFTDASQRFLHDTLVDCLRGIDDLAVKEKPDVEQRLLWAERVEALTLRHHNAPISWDVAARSVRAADGVMASTLYAGQPIDLQPQMGLVPIGMNPSTKLWEFYDLRSAEDPSVIPRFDAEGRLRIDAKSGVVFVLLPGGTGILGAQKEDPQAANFWRDARPDEYPPKAVTLGPVFLARYELTRGQWRRLTGTSPTFIMVDGAELGGKQYDASYPVTHVSWAECDAALRREGMRLPTENEWEYACRSGSSTPWSCGAEATMLQGYANIADETAQRRFTENFPIEKEVVDGWIQDAPVGSFLPNAFGLHDMHGNVLEWCNDVYVRERHAPTRSAGTSPTDTRVSRGGSWWHVANNYARSSYRHASNASFSEKYQGVRAARDLR